MIIYIYIYIYIYIAFEFSFELFSKSWDYKHLLWKSRFNTGTFFFFFWFGFIPLLGICRLTWVLKGRILKFLKLSKVHCKDTAGASSIRLLTSQFLFLKETQLFHLHHKFPFGHFEWSNYTEDSRKKDVNMNTSKRVLGGGKWRTPLSWIHMRNAKNVT